MEQAEQRNKIQKWKIAPNLAPRKTKKRYQIFSDIANAYKMAEWERFELSHGGAV